jgi:hypothetical protein
MVLIEPAMDRKELANSSGVLTTGHSPLSARGHQGARRSWVLVTDVRHLTSGTRALSGEPDRDAAVPPSDVVGQYLAGMSQSQEVLERGGDPLLSLFARLVSDTDAEIHVTLAVGGGVVTGALISQVKWMRLSAESMNATVPGSGVIPDELGKMLLSETPDGAPAEYLHLRDARYLSPTGMMPERPQMLWRGRISEVAGWSWGSFQVS